MSDNFENLTEAANYYMTKIGRTNMKIISSFAHQPAMNGRPEEFAMVIEKGERIVTNCAEGEWFKTKGEAANDMVTFLEAALVVAKSEVVG